MNGLPVVFADSGLLYSPLAPVVFILALLSVWKDWLTLPPRLRNRLPFGLLRQKAKREDDLETAGTEFSHRDEEEGPVNAAFSVPAPRDRTSPNELTEPFLRKASRSTSGGKRNDDLVVDDVVVDDVERGHNSQPQSIETSTRSSTRHWAPEHSPGLGPFPEHSPDVWEDPQHSAHGSSHIIRRIGSMLTGIPAALGGIGQTITGPFASSSQSHAFPPHNPIDTDRISWISNECLDPISSSVSESEWKRDVDRCLKKIFYVSRKKDSFQESLHTGEIELETLVDPNTYSSLVAGDSSVPQQRFEELLLGLRIGFARSHGEDEAAGVTDFLDQWGWLFAVGNMLSLHEKIRDHSFIGRYFKKTPEGFLNLLKDTSKGHELSLDVILPPMVTNGNGRLEPLMATTPLRPMTMTKDRVDIDDVDPGEDIEARSWESPLTVAETSFRLLRAAVFQGAENKNLILIFLSDFLPVRPSRRYGCRGHNDQMHSRHVDDDYDDQSGHRAGFSSYGGHAPQRTSMFRNPDRQALHDFPESPTPGSTSSSTCFRRQRRDPGLRQKTNDVKFQYFVGYYEKVPDKQSLQSVVLRFLRDLLRDH